MIGITARNEYIVERAKSIAKYTADPDIDELKIAITLINYSRMLEKAQPNGIGREVCQFVREMAKAEASVLLSRIRERVFNDDK